MYSAKYLDLWEPLSLLGSRVLKDTGMMIAMVGHDALPEKLTALSKHMDYWSVLAFLTPRQSKRRFDKKISPGYKTLAWFVKKGCKYTGDYQYDVITCPVDTGDREHHVYGQSTDGFIELLERFSSPNSQILEPFCGGGTTVLASLLRGRRCWAVDIDPTCIERTKKRLEKELGIEIKSEL
jgi:DNA modification methylase